MSSLFISYASPDQHFALRLAHSLEQLGHYVWIDVREIQTGHSIPQTVAQAVEQADYLIVVLSRHSTASSWSAHEWNAKFWDEVVTRQTLVLPVVLEECVIPLFLRPKRHANFRSDYAVGLAQLGLMLREPTKVALLPPHLESYKGETQLVQHFLASEATLPLLAPVCYADDRMKDLGRLTETNVELTVPYIGKIAGVWKPDDREQDAAWELYIELVTRISVAELAPSSGLLRESLSSLYSIFTTTRQLLRTYGPAVARAKDGSELSFGLLAINMLNFVLRPVLAKWHPVLLDYEHQKETSMSSLQHETRWERSEELRNELNQVRCILIDYTNVLARISRVPMSIPN